MQVRRPPRWVLAVVVAALTVAALDLVLLVATRHDARPAEARAAGTDHVVVVDPRTHGVVGSVPVGRLPTVVVSGYGSVWVLNRGDGTVSRIDGRSRRLLATYQTDATVNDVAVGAGGVWLAGRPRGGTQRPLEIADLERIDPRTGAIDRRFENATGAAVLAVGGGALWSTGYLGGHIRGAARSDARTGRMQPVDIGIYGDLVAADDTAAYWVASIGNRVARVSTRTLRLTASLPLATDASLAAGVVPPNPTDVTLGGGAVWISTSGGTVVRVDRRLHGVVSSVPVCHNALALTYGLGAVWVACGEQTVVRLDPATGEPGTPIPVDGLPRSIAVGDGAVWVAVG